MYSCEAHGCVCPVSQAGLGGFPHSGSAGVKLEQTMETEQKECRLREAHIMYVQQLAAQQAVLTAARASGAGFMSRGPTHPSRVSNQSSLDSERDRDSDDGMMEGDEGSEEDEQPFGSFSGPGATADVQRASSPAVRVKQEPEDDLSPVGRPSVSPPNGQADWSYEDHFKANRGISWPDDGDVGRGRGEASRDFAKLYELDSDPHRKEFLDDLFTFMLKRGTPVNRIPIMAKQVLDLYKLYKLVTEKGGLVEVINKKIWREITRGLNLPTSITSAAFTLRTQYMKYLYPYECERKALSSPSELQAAIDSNRREGRRATYSNSLFRFSPSPGSAPHLLTPPKMHLSALGNIGALNRLQGPSLKKGLDDGRSSSVALVMGQQQMGLARAATLEQLREKLETDAPERKMLRLAEEQQRLMQQAFQHNLLVMASQIPVNLRPGAPARDEKQDLAVSISSSGAASISMSVEVNGIVYSGTLFAQKSAAASAAPGPSFTFPSSAPSQSPASSSSSKGRSSAEPSTSGSP
ncbi:AT-rich interactive domain-containing protein 3B-like [Carassius carassius]|uniref:AT-rich interactive domain-containing protein 3B-like n=1 Tax=Carassius carassius TaxID=217509 RepID=UPI002869494E|nr:AT-rich interactive domain-containing protein 3B-like [Carassius carassius]